MRWRSGPLLLLFCAVLAACTPTPAEPAPTGTLEPSITESSVEPTSHPRNDACELLTAKERSDLVGMPMDAEVPIQPLPGSHECVWTHSSTEPAHVAIRVVAVDGREWALTTANEQLKRALGHFGTSKRQAAQLNVALRDIATDPRGLSDERVCEIYLLFSETRGMNRAEDMVFGGAIGGLPAFYGAACENGYIVMVGFGEYGLAGSVAVSHAVFRLVTKAVDRVDETLGSSSGDENADESAEGDADETASPEPRDAADGAEDGITEADADTSTDETDEP